MSHRCAHGSGAVRTACSLAKRVGIVFETAFEMTFESVRSRLASMTISAIDKTYCALMGHSYTSAYKSFYGTFVRCSSCGHRKWIS